MPQCQTKCPRPHVCQLTLCWPFTWALKRCRFSTYGQLWMEAVAGGENSMSKGAGVMRIFDPFNNVQTCFQRDVYVLWSHSSVVNWVFTMCHVLLLVLEEYWIFQSCSSLYYLLFHSLYMRQLKIEHTSKWQRQHFNLGYPGPRALNHFAMWPLVYNIEARTHSSLALRWRKQMISAWGIFLGRGRECLWWRQSHFWNLAVEHALCGMLCRCSLMGKHQWAGKGVLPQENNDWLGCGTPVWKWRGR